MQQLHNRDVYEAFSNLFLFHRTDAELPNRVTQEEKELGNTDQAYGVGHATIISSPPPHPTMKLALEEGYDVLRTKQILEYYDKYGWMTGLAMDTTDDGHLQGNEWEHVLPFYFQIIFGGGLHSRTTFDTKASARQNIELLESLDKANQLIKIAEEEGDESRLAIAKQTRAELLEMMAKQLEQTMTSDSHDRFFGLPELNDDLYKDIFSFCGMDRQQQLAIAINRNRLNILCMAKCESYINRCKTNNLFAMLYLGNHVEDTKFYSDEERIKSFMNFVTDPTMTTDDIINDPEQFRHWDRYDRDLRIKELPKNGNLKSGIVKSPSLKPYIKDIMKGNKELLNISIENTKLIMKTVCNQLNLYMKERVLVNCIYFLTGKSGKPTSAKLLYSHQGKDGSVLKKDSVSEGMGIFEAYFFDKLIIKLKDINSKKKITDEFIKDYLKSWFNKKDDRGFNRQFGNAITDEYKEQGRFYTKVGIEAEIKKVKAQLLKKNMIDKIISEINNKKRRVEERSPNTSFEGSLNLSTDSVESPGGESVESSRTFTRSRKGVTHLLEGQSQPYESYQVKAHEHNSSNIFDTKTKNVMKNYIATCFNYLYRDDQEVNQMLKSITDSKLKNLIISLKQQDPRRKVTAKKSGTGGRKKKTRRKRRRKKKKRTRRKRT